MNGHDLKLGIALCHTHFGQIHECRGDYEQAFGEYNISYRLLRAILRQMEFAQIVYSPGQPPFSTRESS